MADISLRLPFYGDFPVTFGFGATSDNEMIQKQFQQWGIVGHNGLDYGLLEGTEVLAAADGKVSQTGDNGDFGISVTIEHNWGQSLYAHLKEARIAVGEEITAGSLIGLSGQSGNAFGQHLHFSIKPSDADTSNGYLGFIDPSPYFEKPKETKEVIQEAQPRTDPPDGGSSTGVIKEVIKEVPVVNQEEVQKRVEETVQDRLKTEQDERRKQANEARRQKKQEHLNKILEFLKGKPTITNDDVRDFLHVSQSTATNYLSELVRQGSLKRAGTRGATTYRA